MKSSDFTNYRKVLDESLGNCVHEFCENCLAPNPEVDDGYTECCNERVIGVATAKIVAKRTDIHAYFESKYDDVSSCYAATGPEKIRFEVNGAKFDLFMQNDADAIIPQILNLEKSL